MASSSWLKTQRSGKVSERLDNMYIEAEEYNGLRTMYWR